MNVAYWIAAGLLAPFYLYSGTLKVARSRERLRPMMAWVDSTPMPVVRAVGMIEVLGAAGLVLPPLTGITPWLALAAAIGFVVLQIGAAGVHLARGDRQVALNITLVLAAAAASWPATTWL
ncbi:DoxX family protein [Kitasatospora sp. NBC_01266]|uniref:DoxX family protein n=1 Tax=Kitasatospora sp. NBC_01266 TaxID=2903572 RepID=UPI002E328F96|nr:DoxX family protein [Kitasatospora sp. NBC_01266]